MALPADRDRWLALGLLLAVLALAYLVLLHPWWTAPMLEQQQRIEALRERDLRARTQLRQAPEVQRLLAQAQALEARNAGFLPESTAELATAGLVQRLETVVVQASPGNVSCAITNRAPMPEARLAGPYARVTVQVRMRCGSSELAAVLHALESSAPRLFVDNLNVLAQRQFSMAGGRGSGGLDVSFDLYGYLRPAPVAPTTSGVARAP